MAHLIIIGGDDDGDGQGIDGVTATGSLNLSIVDKNNRAVTRNKVLTICNSPYKLTLSNSEGTLKTRYGVPNESRFNAGNATYYINPKAAPEICYARPNLSFGPGGYAGPANIWDNGKGFLTQSATPSSYGSNFPTTGANGFYFDLNISGVSQVLSWAPVSHGGITATMTDSPDWGWVRVTLTGPVATYSQWWADNPGLIDRPSLPQVFELVGRDSSGNAVVKYGFELKQWFIHRGNHKNNLSNMSSFCNKIGYRVAKVSDLTNAICPTRYERLCGGAVGATPSSPDYMMRRHIGGGFFSEWGDMRDYREAEFPNYHSISMVRFWTNDSLWDNAVGQRRYYFVNSYDGEFSYTYDTHDYYVACVYP